MRRDISNKIAISRFSFGLFLAISFGLQDQIVLVDNVDRAETFDAEVLGLEVAQNMPVGPNAGRAPKLLRGRAFLAPYFSLMWRLYHD